MAQPEFKKPVNTSSKVEGLVQPDKFMDAPKQTKTWKEYANNIKTQQEEADQAILSVAVEPDMKEAVNKAGKNLGRRNGGTKAVVREALSEYLKKHPELLVD